MSFRYIAFVLASTAATVEGVFAQVPTPPTTRYTVEACASIAGLSSNKKAALAAEGLTRCVNALGLLITSNAACNCDNNLLYAANYVSEILDTDLDGKVDLESTFNTHLNNFDGGDGPKPLQICGATAAAESLTTNSVYLGYSMSCQAWKADTPIGALPILKEEVFHMVQQYVWNFEYPSTFGLSWTATHCTALKAAQCRWWQHGENIGCRDSSGTACIGEDQLTPGKISAARLTASAAYNVPGQCYQDEATCAIASCDCLEWFHKMYLCWLEDSGCYVYSKAQGDCQAPGSECVGIGSESESQLGANGFPIYPWSPANKAAYKSSVETKLGLTAEGQALLAVIQNTAGTYKLPKLITGTYTAVFGVSPSPSPPSPSPPPPSPATATPAATPATTPPATTADPAAAAAAAAANGAWRGFTDDQGLSQVSPMQAKYSLASNLVGWEVVAGKGVVKWHDPPLPGWEGCGKVTSVFGVVICVSPTAWSTTANQVKRVQHGQSTPLGCAPAWLVRLLGRAWRLWAARHSQGRGQATGRPATASGARASRLRSRRFSFPLTLRANFIAHVFFQLLDNDGDGTPDDPAVVHMLIGARMHLSVPYTETEVLTGTPSSGGHMTQTTAIDEAWPNSCDVPSNRGASNTDRSTWAAAVDTSSLTCDPNRDASTEEILHLITTAAAMVYPALWGSATGAQSPGFRTDSDYTSAAGVALKAANGNCGNGATGDFKNPSGGTCVGKYAYDDATCTATCLVVEGIYWASVTYMGGLYTLARSKWATGEWLMATPESNLTLLQAGTANVVSLQTGSPAMYAPLALP